MTMNNKEQTFSIVNYLFCDDNKILLVAIYSNKMWKTRIFYIFFVVGWNGAHTHMWFCCYFMKKKRIEKNIYNIIKENVIYTCIEEKKILS